MENYIQVLGQKIELTEEQVKKIAEGITANKVELGNVPIGETCKVGDWEIVVLEHITDGTAVLFKDLCHNSEEFGDNNNFDGSNVDKLCNDFYEIIAGIVGKDAFVEHELDLTSDDGLKDYGKLTRKMSLLTTERYRRYVEILDNYNPGKWWWLATPHSTERHNNASWVKCVSPSGNLSSDGYYGGIGVRPFCILKSNILVSK